MRNTFINTLVDLAAEDEKINLVVGELGFSVVEAFAERYPDRYLNAGILEQTMTGLAAGLALASDAVVFTYSIANFSVMRCFEQIRNDVCFHNANVKIIAVGGGVSYGTQGYTHFAVEDLAVTRALPNLTVVAPSDPAEARAIAELATRTPGPWYIRLGKNGEANLHPHAIRNMKPGNTLELRAGTDGTVLATGAIAHEAMLAAERLSADSGLAIRVVSVPFLSPFDAEGILAIASESPWLLTVEEHTGVGGLGSAVAEVFVDHGVVTPLRRCHLGSDNSRIGSQSYLRRIHGIDASGIVDSIGALVGSLK